MDKNKVEFNYEEFDKRYDKFKNNNLPTPFWDEERQTHEYVWFDDELNVQSEIFEALSDIAVTGLYYPYITKHYEGNSIQGWELVVGHTHGHSFNDVVKDLYNSPESFMIEKKDYKYYSKQELEYLKDIQKYLLLIGAKDHPEGKRPQSSYRSTKQKKYLHSYVWHMNNENIRRIQDGKLDFIIRNWSKFIEECEFKSFNVLIKDDNGDYKFHIKITSIETIKHSDIKNYTFKKNYKPNKKFMAFHFKVLETI